MIQNMIKVGEEENIEIQHFWNSSEKLKEIVVYIYVGTVLSILA